MANFVVVVDPDAERRWQFINYIQPLLPPVDGLITHSCTIGNFHASWAVNRNAPISWVADAEGAAVIWGDAIPSHQSYPLDSQALRLLWKESSPTALPAFDGFYAAVAYHPDLGLTVSADHLGLFPIYYYVTGDIALIASTPELFRHHPLFHTAFNPVGLVGILLSNCLFEGQTLWKNVQRLTASHALIWKPGTTPQQIQQHKLLDERLFKFDDSLSFSEQLDILDQALDKSLNLQVPAGKQYGLLLSGGLDSRMLAGFLHRQGIKPTTLSLGKRSDIEIECALSVVRKLGLTNRIVAIAEDKYPAYANSLVKWEHLANGFNWVMNWGLEPHLSHFTPKVINGYLMDLVLGGKIPYALESDNLCFENFFRGMNSWGLSPKLLEKLLRKEIFGELVAKTVAQMRTVYESYSELEFRKAWYFEIYHRQRFHVGSAGWQLCFGSWPIIPILDRQLLAITAALPVETITKRKAQIELVCTRFPQLAQLPLDRNSFNVEPLLPSKSRQQFARLFNLQSRWRKRQQRLGYERRYYYRIYDINNLGWQGIRQQAEPYRERIEHLFHPEVLNKLLPAPNLPVQSSKDAIVGVSGIKALLGLMLWSKDNF
ncbi:MAG: hypothetical protein F6K36_18235 [Symploca sp. SIO3C6]|nr:hypothetical protein [Symploca sp. SIO3C6]